MSNRFEQYLDEWIYAHQSELIAFLSRLVQVPSEVIPPEGNELACQRLVEEVYRSAGAEVDVFDPEEVAGLRQHPLYYGLWDGKPRNLAGRPDVVGVFRGCGGGKSLLLSAHVDTVPAGDPTGWKEAEPFGGTVRHGKLFGRGSWDTKCGIAIGLFAMRSVLACGIKLRGDVILESVSDEEFGGSHGTLAARLRGYNADIAINSEPTGMIVAPAHRGGTSWKITVRGEPGRGFSGQKLANPVYKLAKVIEAIQAYDQMRSPFSNPPRFYKSDPSLPTYIQQITGGGSTFAESIGSPAECSLSLWTEEHPGTTEEVHQKRFIEFLDTSLAQEPGFDGVFPEYQQQIRFLPGSFIEPVHPFFDCLKHGFISSGLDFKMDGARFACDTYVFNLYSSTPALTLGPRGGNAHSSDEYVLIQDVIDLARVYAKAIAAWCA